MFLLPVILLAAATAGCVGPAEDALSGFSPSQPRMATYSCGNGDVLRIENRRGSVVVMKADGESIELPASPPRQQNRYGEPPYALVLEDRDALFMVTGQEPVDCRR